MQGKQAQYTLLIVEDDALVRLNSAEYLRESGYEVVEASDGAEAQEILSKPHHGIDLVFSDIRMPGPTDGIRLVHWLREREPGIPAILASGYWESAKSEQALIDGELPMLKPYDLGELTARIERALARRVERT